MGKIQNGSFDLPDAEDAYMSVVIKVNKVSQRAFIAECVKGNLIRLRNVYRDRIQYEADKLGITWEQCFNLYNSFDEITDENIEAAKAMQPTIHKEYGRTNLGNEEKTKS